MILGIIFDVFLYFMLGLAVSVSVLFNVGTVFGKWYDSAKSEEASFVIIFICVLIWPVILGYYLFWIPRYLWRGLRNSGYALRYFGRGVRDLMPRGRAKIPVAKVLTKE